MCPARDTAALVRARSGGDLSVCQPRWPWLRVAISCVHAGRIAASPRTKMWRRLWSSCFPSRPPLLPLNKGSDEVNVRQLDGASTHLSGPLVDNLSRWDEPTYSASELKQALASSILVDAGWLVELAARGGVLPRCQAVPEAAKVSLREMEAWRDSLFPGQKWVPEEGLTLGVLVISYPWLDAHHPDAYGEQLRSIAPVLKIFADEARKHEGCRLGVFWDYCSLPQKNTDGSDDRTEEERARFKRALGSINAWYGHRLTHVLLVNTELPTGHSYTNTQPYDRRGWCYAEMCMSAMIKDDWCLISMKDLTGGETDLGALRMNGKARRLPPMAPDSFHKCLSAGVKDGSIKFTYNGDADLVANIYTDAFVFALGRSRILTYSDLDWGDEQIQVLATALLYMHTHHSLKLEELNLNMNDISNIGVLALISAISDGALSKLKELNLNNNPIDAAGVHHLSSAIASGGLPDLSHLYLYPVGAQAMRAGLEVHPLRTLSSAPAEPSMVIGAMPFSL